MINEQSMKDRIRTIAQKRSIPFNACWKQLLLERFLARLAGSTYSHIFIFKGGFLLSYLMPIGRETMDLDFLLTKMKAGQKEIQGAFEKIISIHSNDGFSFSFDSMNLLTQPHMEYPGYRVFLRTTFGKMKDKIQVDVGVGDSVDPLMYKIPLIEHQGKPLFEETISLHVYPIETIFSEKFEAILSKGTSNSRMKDYHDLMFLIQGKERLNFSTLKKAITNTFSNRGTIFKPIEFGQLLLPKGRSL